MSKKSKQKASPGSSRGGDKSSGESRFKLGISGDAQRNLAAVFLFTLSILFILGFFGLAGVLGNFLDRAIGTMFGWGKWLFPAVLAIGAAILIRRKTPLFYIAKLVGLGMIYISLLGFFHLYFEFSQLKEVAQEGMGGGYLGMSIAWMLTRFTGKIAGTVILMTFFMTGLILAFNFSVAGAYQLLKGKIGKIGGEENGENGQMKPGIPEADSLAGNETGSVDNGEAEEGDKKERIEKANIKSIEFVQGPDEKKQGSGKSVSKSEKNLISENAAETGDHDEKFPATISGKSWRLPPVNLLKISKAVPQGGDIKQKVKIIEDTFRHFGIDVEAAGELTGPTVTQYAFRPAFGVKLSRITALQNNLALALAAYSVRIEAPIPGKSLIGIEVPNDVTANVSLREILESDSFKRRRNNLTLLLGKDVSGEYIAGNLAKMPHLLIAGSTGSGKSVCINSILLSLLYQNSPDELKLILVDPKRVELSLYQGIPHLLSPVITESKKVVGALRWAVGEMENRYRLLQDTASRDLNSYNHKVAAGEKRRYKDPETGEEKEESLSRLPYVIIVIDELADLMMAHGKEVESAIIRIAQMARAVGIHLIVSTQRPSVEVITGLIKANISTRIALQVASQIDSRTILDMGGAEKLIGNGDMLYLAPDKAKPRRLQGVFVSEEEAKIVVKFINSQKSEFKDNEEDILESGSPSESMDFEQQSVNDADEDPLYEEAKKIVIKDKKASTSYLQRRLRVGYGRAARLLDMLQEEGVVSHQDGSKARQVLVEIGSETGYEDDTEDQSKRDKWQMDQGR